MAVSFHNITSVVIRDRVHHFLELVVLIFSKADLTSEDWGDFVYLHVIVIVLIILQLYQFLQTLLRK